MDCKIPDVGPVLVEMCKLKKTGWTLNVQRLDGIKLPILVPGASEVSLCIKPGQILYTPLSQIPQECICSSVITTCIHCTRHLALCIKLVYVQSLPIVKLRECVEKCTGVPTHQQRLTIGSTIVEDWDDEDRMMFIGDYPNIHDGSLLYLVQLEGGSRMTVKHKESKSLELVKNGTTEFCYKTGYFYISSIKVRYLKRN